jgi:hypothetical protein
MKEIKKRRQFFFVFLSFFCFLWSLYKYVRTTSNMEHLRYSIRHQAVYSRFSQLSNAKRNVFASLVFSCGKMCREEPFDPFPFFLKGYLEERG